TELNTGLVKLGYTTAAALGPRSGWAYYGTETAYAVGLLQAKLGLTETGTLSLGEAVFLPGPALISGWGTGTSLGAPAAPGPAGLGGLRGHHHRAGVADPSESGREAEPGPGHGDDHHRQRAQRADGAGERAAGADRRRVRGGGDRPRRPSPGEGDAGPVR